MNLSAMLTEFYARGFDYLNDNGPGEVRATRWINQSYLEICELDDWPFLQASSTAPLPATISDLGTVESATNTVTQSPIKFVDRRSLVDAYSDLTTLGSPLYGYITYGTTVNGYPVSSSENVTVWYWKVPTELTLTTDSPVMPARYHYAIIDYACARAYMDSDNPDMAQAARRDGEALVALMRERLLTQQHQDADEVVVYGYSSDAP